MLKHNYDNKLESYSEIKDIESLYTANHPIEQFIHCNNRSIPETPSSQIRLLKKWGTYRNNLIGFTQKSKEEIRDYQLQRISILCDVAFNTIPFYRKIYGDIGFEEGDIVTWSDFESLPIINKEMIVKNSEQLLNPNNNSALNTARTSGSSGVNLTIKQGSSSVDYRCLLYMRHCEQMIGRRLMPNDLRYGVYFAAERFSSLAGMYPYLTVSQECPPNLFLEHITRIKPNLLLAFPSYLKKLTKNKVDFKGLGVEAICTNSESSTQEERDSFEKIFGVKVYDEYSSEEMSLTPNKVGGTFRRI